MCREKDRRTDISAEAARIILMPALGLVEYLKTERETPSALFYRQLPNFGLEPLKPVARKGQRISKEHLKGYKQAIGSLPPSDRFLLGLILWFVEQVEHKGRTPKDALFAFGELIFGNMDSEQLAEFDQFIAEQLSNLQKEDESTGERLT